jgi:hypothetical protein
MLPIDDGVRDVDVVTHRRFTSTNRNKAMKVSNQEKDLKGGALEPLKMGDFVVLQVSVENCPAYTFDHVIAQVIEDCSLLDTTHPETPIHFQIFRPATLTNISSKLLPWIGDKNKPWKDRFSRGLVKALVQVQVKEKKVTAKSLTLIKDKFF